MDDFVEVRGKSVDIAIEVAMKELGADDRSKVEVQVVQEPEKAVLGLFGGRDAIVRVAKKPEAPKKRRRRRKKKGDGEDRGRRDQEKGGQRGQQRGQGGGGSGDRSRQARGDRQQGSGQKGGGKGRNQGDNGSGSQGRGGGKSGGGSRNQGERSSERSGSKREERDVTIEEQMPVVEEFLTGLVGAFGLEGGVEVSADGDVIVANVTGSQTEAMVGPRGSVIESIHELTKTVLHRRTQSSARVRLDVAGYAERRRQALSIYANQLLDQVFEEGGEVMLEPMSASDRKVIHDAVAERDGVRSYSEGQAPQRYVVIAREEEGSSEEE